jgi:hypothetical protein
LTTCFPCCEPRENKKRDKTEKERASEHLTIQVRCCLLAHVVAPASKCIRSVLLLPCLSFLCPCMPNAAVGPLSRCLPFVFLPVSSSPSPLLSLFNTSSLLHSSRRDRHHSPISISIYPILRLTLHLQVGPCIGPPISVTRSTVNRASLLQFLLQPVLLGLPDRLFCFLFRPFFSSSCRLLSLPRRTLSPLRIHQGFVVCYPFNRLALLPFSSALVSYNNTIRQVTTVFLFLVRFSCPSLVRLAVFSPFTFTLTLSLSHATHRPPLSPCSFPISPILVTASPSLLLGLALVFSTPASTLLPFTHLIQANLVPKRLCGLDCCAPLCTRCCAFSIVSCLNLHILRRRGQLRHFCPLLDILLHR